MLGLYIYAGFTLDTALKESMTVDLKELDCNEPARIKDNKQSMDSSLGSIFCI